jgi:hypothetical protein
MEPFCNDSCRHPSFADVRTKGNGKERSRVGKIGWTYPRGRGGRIVSCGQYQINRTLIGVSVIIRVPPKEAFKIQRDDG